MPTSHPPKGAFTPKKVRKSIKLDRVSPKDFLHTNMIYCCEQCSHFNSNNQTCTLGYKTEPHLKKQQLAGFSSHGHMAFCRFAEID